MQIFPIYFGFFRIPSSEIYKLNRSKMPANVYIKQSGIKWHNIAFKYFSDSD
jgi:hypothetical protein